MRKFLKFVAVVVLLAAAALGWGWWQSEVALGKALPVVAADTVIVAPGSGLRAVLGGLAERRLLQHPRLIEWRMRAMGEVALLHAGRYALEPGMTLSQLLGNMASGQVILAQLTIPEGWSFAQMRALLEAQPGLQHEFKGLSNEALMQQLGHAGQNPEGSFFPDSYRYADGSSERVIYQLAFDRMQRELASDWESRAPDLPLKTPQEALILASIIEKETGRADERGQVAAVFVNRLKIGMRLQSDPTVIYGLGESYDGDIRTRDLHTDTPYNSYTRDGLPPTPICLPGAASLHATLHPDNSAALYFVATGEGDGRHHFSATYAEHQLALQRYLRRIGFTPR